MCCSGPRNEAWNDYPGMAGRPESIHDPQEGTSLPASCKASQEQASSPQHDAMAFAIRLCAQIGDIGAIDIIFAHGEWMEALRQALRALGDRRDHIQ